MNKEKVDGLTSHFFRNEYGKLVSVVSRYLGVDRMETAEDVAQETLLKATKVWQHRGVPPNPAAWLYKTAIHHALNIVKRDGRHSQIQHELSQINNTIQSLDWEEVSDHTFSDDQLNMMFHCCDNVNSKDAQVVLILKILCGFSIDEIARAYFSNYETINKKLSRARKKLKTINFRKDRISRIDEKLDTVLMTVYLLFNEGYKPRSKNEIIRKELCFEAIRLTDILHTSDLVKNKTKCEALLALMYLNAARFDARMQHDVLVDMAEQDRNLWNKPFIDQGIYFLDQASQANCVNLYMILATISAQHCIAESYEQTNWRAIMTQYDNLIKLDDSPLVRLNRAVASSYVTGVASAIQELKHLDVERKLELNHLYHLTLGDFYSRAQAYEQARGHLNIAMKLADNALDKDFIQKKINQLVPV